MKNSPLDGFRFHGDQLRMREALALGISRYWSCLNYEWNFNFMCLL